jgi:hypothetical protein
VLPEHAVDGFGVHVAAGFLTLAIVTKRAKHRSVEILGVASRIAPGRASMSDFSIE